LSQYALVIPANEPRTVNLKKTHVTFVKRPQLEHIEARFSRYTDFTFKKHFHETYAIGIVEQGRCSFYHLDRTDYIEEGTIVLINPGEVHACNPRNHFPWAYKMFYIDTTLISHVTRDIYDTEALPAFTDSAVENPMLYRELVSLYATIHNSKDILEKDTSITTTIAQIVLNYTDHQTLPRLPKKAFKATEIAHEYLLDNLAKNVSLQKLSSIAGLSTYHLLRMFQHRFGLSPHKFQVQKRIHVAKELLAEGQSISQVAFDLGFTDQSHFTNKFRVFVGTTPRQYQMAVR
jgi:AraC-like DNA-binding protein